MFVEEIKGEKNIFRKVEEKNNRGKKRRMKNIFSKKNRKKINIFE